MTNTSKSSQTGQYQSDNFYALCVKRYPAGKYLVVGRANAYSKDSNATAMLSITTGGLQTTTSDRSTDFWITTVDHLGLSTLSQGRTVTTWRVVELDREMAINFYGTIGTASSQTNTYFEKPRMMVVKLS